MGRVCAALALAALAGGCASLLWVRPLVVDDYATVHIRIYRNGSTCRIEVLTPAETLQQVPTHCWTVPNMHRAP
jgi:hypothetical protein